MRYELGGKVVPKMRPRFDPRTKRAYHDERYSGYLEAAAWELKSQHSGPILTSAVALKVDFCDDGTYIVVEPIRMSTRPEGQRGDIDNMVGSVMDAMNGVVFNDDARVEALLVTFNEKGVLGI